MVAEVGHRQVAQQQPAVGVRVGAHPACAVRCEGGQLGDEPPGGVEQLLGPVAAHPLLELRAVLGVGVGLGQRHLVGAPGALDREAVDDLRSGPALRGAQHDHRPGRTMARRGCAPCRVLDLGDVVEHGVERGGELLVHGRGIVACHEMRGVAVAAHQLGQLVGGDPGQHRGVGDLVAVEVQHREDGAVGDRVEELVGMPARRHRSGLGLPVADDTQRQQVGVVQHGAVGVQ